MTKLRANPMAALSVLLLAMFMTLLDLTIVNIAIPQILDGLHASFDQVLWVLNAYSLLYAVLLITSARLGDIYGPRNLFAIGIAIFTVASVLSGLAQDANQLIAARALQGLGAAVLGPQGMPLMMSLFAPDKRGGAFAAYGMTGGLAVMAGPTLGGLLVTHFGWRWIFFVNLPIGVVTLALAFLFIPDVRPGRRHRLDLVGVAMATAGLLAVIFGLIEGQRYDWGVVAGGITIPMIIGTGLAILAAFLYYQSRRQRGEPLLPFAVFKDRNFTLMTLVMAALGFAMLGFYLPLTIYMQSVLRTRSSRRSSSRTSMVAASDVSAAAAASSGSKGSPATAAPSSKSRPLSDTKESSSPSDATTADGIPENEMSAAVLASPTWSNDRASCSR